MMEEEFDKWLEAIRNLKDLSDNELGVAKLALYQAYTFGLNDGLKEGYKDGYGVGYEKGREDEFTIGQEWN
jgi:hypothetical protein